MATNWRYLGEQMMNSLGDALSTGDFSQLNYLIQDTVHSAVEDFQQGYYSPGQNTYGSSAYGQNQTNSYGSTSYGQGQAGAYTSSAYGQNQTNSYGSTSYSQNQTGAYSAGTYPQATKGATPPAGTATTTTTALATYQPEGLVTRGRVLALCGGGMFALVSIYFLICLCSMLADPTAPLRRIVIPLVAMGIFGVPASGGIRLLSMKKRADQYYINCEKTGYVALEDLSLDTKKSKNYLEKDLQRMIKDGIFPQGRLDAAGTTFMLTKDVYQQYEAAMLANKAREEQSKAAANESEFDKMLRQGRAYIDRLHALNDLIAEEDITRKLYTLEDRLNEIFDRLKRNPSQQNKCHKLMDYYLPTTIKLVEAYHEFDRTKAPGQDVEEAKVQIKATLDTINEAFVELLANLFRDAAFDASTDAKVLQTMLAKEGLAKMSKNSL